MGKSRPANGILSQPSLTLTDHISPAGPFGAELLAGQWLLYQDVEPGEFNTYGARRGNHEVIMRATVVNVRIENEMFDDVEGG